MTTDPWIEDLRRELAERNMSAAELARRCDVQPGTVRKWLTYKSRPYLELRRRVDEALTMVVPVTTAEDVELQKAIYAHPDLLGEAAGHVWDYARHVIEGERKRRQQGG